MMHCHHISNIMAKYKLFSPESIATSAKALYRDVVDHTTNVTKDLYQLAANRRVRLAVTGLSRSGKSVFITSLVNQLLEASQQQHRLTRVTAVQQGRFLAAQEAPQPDGTVPTFRYDDYKDMLLDAQPQWPASTEDISQIRLHIRTKPSGFLDRNLSDHQNLYLDIIDYPGEWLVDLTMLELDFDAWSQQIIEQSRQPQLYDLSASWRNYLEQQDCHARCKRQTVEHAHRLFRDYLLAAKTQGYNFLQPGRILLPGLLAGSPAVTFCPCPHPAQTPQTQSLYTQLADRFEMYKKEVIQPFYQQHFSKFDCQVVLVDLMYALQQGQAHFEDTATTLNALLASFRHGRSKILSRLFNPQIDRILCAVTKADQINQSHHQNLQKLLQSMLRPTIKKTEFEDLRYMILALASIKATETIHEDGHHETTKDYIRGRLSQDDPSAPAKELHYPPGSVPDQIPSATSWQNNPFLFYSFHPPVLQLKAGQSFPHINMDKAIEFLLGDRL